ncbi:alpha-1,3-galactosyltransferase 2-like [Cynoglossus semilaevis]|uniref:alpha-1,3-galactosyltransferase 2-like n=1 Tax=Cynoglossus semilaevis TaxID=244447 RepID=UPI0004978F9A|nr:alpha-1,3-galactosyltransferase 2-like [Cynoglossus semilaevis]XP_008308333.1 alpha-1,3-galactosyltransferase 2-like [Cynoglossus semilaevis]XP_008308334.1 alpha-1,3-galactosyltransferase 2-like [Cynoglossus semilaevis]XP_016887905.1 alpha-1,3-galactosyltransferase 2-like [Cynoglossus semilaevis]XP_016887906.1 alpha-1,3-galactosyltransferase 2-like [Cynoglossus semilaevis]
MSVLIRKLRTAGTLCGCFFFVISLNFIYTRYFSKVPLSNWATNNDELKELFDADITLNYGARTDVTTISSWKAPIMWEGMFDPNVYDRMHIHFGSNVAVTVFAVGRYLDVYLLNFLNSAERYFMVGLPVKYYVFTDTPEKVPKVALGHKRSMKVLKVDRYDRWQDISMMRMQTISEIIESEIRYSFRYVYCFDVDQVFKGRFGSEALGDSVAMIHSQFYRYPKYRYTFDKNPQSKAFMKVGDLYYHAAVFGGSWENVKNLTDTCYENIMVDKIRNVEALWHDESHLNRFFFDNKPTKLLSPEYCWNEIFPDQDIRVPRLVWAPKYYDTLRT